MDLPTLQIRAGFEPKTIDKEKRTIEVVWSVGKKGLRRTWGGSYFEQLSMDPGHVKMERLASGNAPLMDAHDQWSGCSAVIGVVEDAKIENGVGTARVRFADTQDVETIWRKIETGILKNVSVGYNVTRYERQPQADGEDIPTYLAVDWEPAEISIVPVGFDDRAVVRGKDNPGTRCVFTTDFQERKEETQDMKPEQERSTTTTQSPAPATQPSVDVEKERKEAGEKAAAAERSRQAEIRKLATRHNLPAEFADKLCNEGTPVDQARELVLDELAKKTDAVDTRTGVTRISGGQPSQVAERKQGLENAMLHRANPSQVKLTDAGRNFRGMTLLEMARDILEAGGSSTRGLSKMELATRAFHSSSDFPEVLANVANKTLRKGYDEAPRTFTGWAKQATLPDFKQVSRTQLGEAPDLEKVLENGEIKRGTIGEGAEKYQLATYAKIFGISRQAIINDDLNAFANIPSKFGFAAASLESDVVYAILTANAALSDGVTLFHSTHKNLGSAGVPSITTLGEFRKLLRVQKGVNGKRILNLQLKYLIVPAALETLAEQLCVLTTVPTQDSNTNPFKGRLTPVAEPRLDAASAQVYYGACDPSQCDTVEYGYLEGQEGVYTESRMGFDVDGMEIKARLDFAAKAIDFRGLVKNTG
jgi:hypothetical protein